MSRIRGMRNEYRIAVKNTKESDRLEDLWVDWNAILKCTSNEQVASVPGEGQVTEFCEHEKGLFTAR